MALDTDLFVAVGLTTALLAIPSIAGAVVEERIPKRALTALGLGVIVAGIGMVFAPNGYRLGQVPHSFVEILARIVN